jgi:hypothetical protein
MDLSGLGAQWWHPGVEARPRLRRASRDRFAEWESSVAGRAIGASWIVGLGLAFGLDEILYAALVVSVVALVFVVPLGQRSGQRSGNIARSARGGRTENLDGRGGFRTCELSRVKSHGGIER